MFEKIISNTSTVVVGNSEKIKLTLAAIISEGSILIEDHPGSGKTTFSKAITQSLGLNFKRVQFTSDLLPSDILGFNIFLDGKLNFQKGPIFTNIVLADELNRGSPKSQSAFLEAMEEKKVSIVVKVSPDLHLKITASQLVKGISIFFGGSGGGGRNDLAQGGGNDPSKIKELNN